MNPVSGALVFTFWLQNNSTLIGIVYWDSRKDPFCRKYWLLKNQLWTHKPSFSLYIREYWGSRRLIIASSILLRHMVHVLCPRLQWAETTKLEKLLEAKKGPYLQHSGLHEKESKGSPVTDYIDLLNPHQKWIPKQCGLHFDSWCMAKCRIKHSQILPDLCMLSTWCKVRAKYMFYFSYLQSH